MEHIFSFISGMWAFPRKKGKNSSMPIRKPRGIFYNYFKPQRDLPAMTNVLNSEELAFVRFNCYPIELAWKSFQDSQWQGTSFYDYYWSEKTFLKVKFSLYELIYVKMRLPLTPESPSNLLVDIGWGSIIVSLRLVQKPVFLGGCFGFCIAPDEDHVMGLQNNLRSHTGNSNTPALLVFVRPLPPQDLPNFTIAFVISFHAFSVSRDCFRVCGVLDFTKSVICAMTDDAAKLSEPQCGYSFVSPLDDTVWVNVQTVTVVNH